MAISKHTQGSVAVEGNTIPTVDATISVTINTGDTTPIGVSWEEAVELHKSWEMTLSTNYDSTATAQAALITGFTSGDATFTSVTLTEVTSGIYTGSALLTSATVTKAVGSPDKANYTFKGQSALSHTTR